jgi:leucyl aminopeptidase
MKFNISTKLDKQSDLILPFQKSNLDWAKYTNTLPGIQPDFEGGYKEVQLIYGKSGQRIYLLGLGEAKDLPKLSQAFQELYFKFGKYWSDSIQIDCRSWSSESITKAVTGMEMGDYKIGAFKSAADPLASGSGSASKNELEVRIVCPAKNKEAVEEGKATGASINSIKALVDAPPNVKTPKYLAKWAKESAQAYGYDCEILKPKRLEKEGFDALLSVGQGSVNSPRLIVNRYFPKKKNTVDLALVGKGITFDSGGLSIKDSMNLHYMKSDMGGAAAVLGAVELAAKLKLNINIVGIVASAENAVDANSYRPGDVINSYSGKTIEIIDTDAEGRLALADGLSYVIRQYQPKQVIDLATLTGSVVRALGYSAAGMFSANPEMVKAMTAAGAVNQERVWSLPLFEDFEEDLHSDIADIRNFSGKPIAGAITAAKFLEAFTEDHDHWMHLDIAGVAFGSSPFAKMKSASGYGVRLLTEYMKSLQP